MSSTLLIIFLSTADREGPVGPAMTRALREALGPQVELSVRAAALPPDDGALEREREAAGAQAAARVIWDNDDRLRAEVSVVVGQQPSGYHQVVQFSPSDPLSERGRALGVVIAYHLVALRAQPAPSSPPAPPPPPPVLQAPAPSAGDRAPAAGPWSLEAFAALGVPLRGPGAGLGGGLGLRWLGDRRWGARLSARLRGAEIGAAQASYSGWALAGGVLRSIRSEPAGAIPALVFRLEGVLLYESLTHFSSDDPAPVRSGRLLPAVSTSLELSWRLTRTAALSLNAGVEMASGPTEILVRRTKVAELSPWRAVAEAGFRAHF